MTSARLRLPGSGGLYLEVQPTGRKHRRWKHRYAGREKQLALGTYPDVSLARARLARAQLAEGADPVQAKIDARQAACIRLATNFEAVARAWFEHWSGPRAERHAVYVMRRLEADVFPAIGRKPIADITAPQLLAMAKAVESRGALDIAKRALQTCGQIMRYAVVHGVIERNPAADVKPSDALRPRRKTNFARLEAKEVPTLLRRIDAYSDTPHTRLAMQRSRPAAIGSSAMAWHARASPSPLPSSTPASSWGTR